MAIHEIYSNKNAIRVCGNNTYYKKFFTADSLADVAFMNTHGNGFLRYPAGTAVLCFEDSTVYVLTRDDNPYGDVNDEENAEFIPMGGGVTPQQLEEALTTKQDLLTAGTGIGITEDEIRVTYGESHYGEPVYNAPLAQAEYTEVETLYYGIASNGTRGGVRLVTEDDIIEIETNTTAAGLAFDDVADGDQYQQNIVAFAQQASLAVRYAACVNCHGAYIAPDFSTGYLVADSTGTEQTEDAYILALAETEDGDPLLLVLANNDYPMTGTYTISKKYYVTIPATALDYSVVAKKTAVIEQTAPTAITLADNTEYYLTNVSDLSITYPSGRFESWIRLTTATEGTITEILPTSQYVGTAPTFGNGETWEISIKDGVVAAAKVGDGA